LGKKNGHLLFRFICNHSLATNQAGLASRTFLFIIAYSLTSKHSEVTGLSLRNYNTMLPIIRGLSLGLALLSACADAAPNPAAQRRTAAAHTGKAIYFLTNDKQNAVVALPIASDGTLGKGTVTPTGDSGSHAISGGGNTGADALISQAALTVAGNVSFCTPPSSSRR
jgi:hypothetical protein